MFYSSFIPGFEDVVKSILINEDVEIVSILNGAVITKTTHEKISSFPFLNNHFKILKLDKNKDFNQFISDINKVKLNKSKISRGFRVIVSKENTLISMDNKLLNNVYNKIQRETLNYPNKAKPLVEYYILKRSEGIILFMERINKHKSFDKVLNRGELRSDLCYFLNYLSDPEDNDIVLDAFCGSGAILKNRVTNFKYNMLFGIDINSDSIKDLKGRFKNRNNIIFKNINFFDNKFDDEFITKIVTDPPWGMYEKMDDVQEFYNKVFKEFYRILSFSGKLVVFSACKAEVINASKQFKLLNKYDVLYSGKKASVFVFVK